MTTHVRVLITEDGKHVGELNLDYFAGQDYVVQIVTPDGVDATQARKAGVRKPELRSLTAEDFGHSVKA